MYSHSPGGSSLLLCPVHYSMGACIVGLCLWQHEWWCNSGLTKLQSIFNAAAHLVFSARKSEHISLLLPRVTLVGSSNFSTLVMCSFSCIVALTARCRHTLPRPSSWPPMLAQSAFSECFNVEWRTMLDDGALPVASCLSVECFSVICSLCAITAAISPRPEDNTDPVISYSLR